MSRTAPPQNFYNESAVLGTRKVVKPVRLQLPPAHPKQFELISALDTIPGSRFIVGACGTKFGKTYGSTIALVQQAWNHKDSLNWWVAPTFAQSKMAYSLVKRLLPQGTFVEHKSDLKITLLQPDGSEYSTIEFKSGDNSDSLRGFGVNFFVMDEAARCPYESFVSLMTTVTQTHGKGFFISTPHARNWFYDVYKWGEKTDGDGVQIFDKNNPDPHPDWFSIRMPTWSNPHVKLESLREMKRNLPEDVFRQEVGAQFLLDSAGVFIGIKDCIRGQMEDPIAGHRYVMGVDLARLKDFSVITVVDRERMHVVYFERFNQIAWEVQYHRIIAAARRYNNALVVMDSTGLGDPIVQTVQNAGVRVVPYKISGTAPKQQLIDKLRVNIEHQRISFPLVPIMKRELEAYEYEVSDSGAVKFSAPQGMNDDTVISLALANYGADQQDFVYRYRSVRGI
jgi:hypothetical protein